MSIKKNIVKLLDDPSEFIINNDINILIDIIKYCSKKYYNNEAVISDEIYDILIDTVKNLDPNNKILNTIGAKVISKFKVKLPYFMGSMNKIKNSDINLLKKWILKYNGPYCLSDKLDGISALFVFNNNESKLYTRGDGIEGTDISDLIKYIPNLKNINFKENLSVRGELIMSKENFKKYNDKMANARNMVSGIVNSKKIQISILNDIDFIVYELIDPWIKNQLEQFKQLEKLGFEVVKYLSNIDVNIDNLSSILLNQKNISKYEIDGIIISNIIIPNRSLNINPEYAFAFKDDTLNKIANVKVLKIKWAISKDGYIKPILELEPTKLGGVVISNVTAYNAKYVVDNSLGKDSEILLIRSGDVIPKILKVLKKSKNPDLPNIKYKWTESGVDIITIDDTEEQKIKELIFFFKNLGIKNIDKGIVKKLIDSNIDNLNKIINIQISDLENIDGFKNKLTNKIYNNIISKINNMTLLDLMVASNLFGHGIGRKKLKKILEVYPNILKIKNINISEINGFDTITNNQFIIGLNKFKIFFDTLDKSLQKRLLILDVKNNNKEIFKDMIIVFSGFRNNDWEKIIELNGGKVSNSVSSKTTLLIIIDENDMSSSKIKKALDLNIDIMNKEDFQNIFINDI